MNEPTGFTLAKWKEMKRIITEMPQRPFLRALILRKDAFDHFDREEFPADEFDIIFRGKDVIIHELKEHALNKFLRAVPEDFQ